MADNSNSLVPTNYKAEFRKKDEIIQRLSDTDSGQYSKITDRMLANQKISDADVIGNYLDKLIDTARENDPNNEKKGIVAKIFGAAKKTKSQLLAKSETIRQKIDKIVSEIDKQIDLHERRQTDIDDMIEYNEQYDFQLKNAIKRGYEIRSELEAYRDEISAITGDDAPKPSDIIAINNQILRVASLIEEFESNRLRCEQVSNELEMSKQDGISIIQLVKTAKISLIPNWERTLIQNILNREQAASISAQQRMRESNNAAQRALGEQMTQNSINVANLMGEASTSMETLTVLNDRLIDVNAKVKEINKESLKRMAENSIKRKELSDSLQKSVNTL